MLAEHVEAEEVVIDYDHVVFGGNPEVRDRSLGNSTLFGNLFAVQILVVLLMRSNSEVVGLVEED